MCAVADGVPLAIGDRHAPLRPVAASRGGRQVAGQVGVDGANPVHLAEMLAMVAPERVAAIPARVTDSTGQPEIWRAISALSGRRSSRQGSRPVSWRTGRLRSGTRMASSDGQRTSGSAEMSELSKYLFRGSAHSGSYRLRLLVGSMLTGRHVDPRLEDGMAASIFISHSSQHFDAPLRLPQGLKRTGLNVWPDEWEIAPVATGIARGGSNELGSGSACITAPPAGLSPPFS